MKYPQFYFESAETLHYIRHCECCLWDSNQGYATDDEGETTCPDCGNDALEAQSEYL
jgi:hypothetical protein